MATSEDRFFGSSARHADALPDGVVVSDATGRIVSVNARLLALTGYAEASLLGKPVETLVAEDRRDVHVVQRESFLRHPTVRPMGTPLDLICRRADGTTFAADIALSPLDADGQRYVIATVRDADERRAVDTARREVEERFRLLVESVPGTAIFMLDPQGRVSTWNVGAERLKGYAADDILGKRYDIFYTPEERAAKEPERLLAEAAAAGRAEQFGWRVRRDGSRFQASVSITASRDPDGRLRGFTKITRDISGALQARDDLERLHLLEQREHLGRDLHDGAIQALFAVGMGLQALLRTVADDEVAAPLDEAVRALDEIISELRGFIFGLGDELTPAQLRQALERLAADVQARSGIQVTGAVDEAALARVGTRGRNLLLVAREAVSNVERHSRASRCTLSLRPGPKGTVELVVEDDGSGFDDAATSGGLGLTNARSRALEMRAEHSIETSPRGTRVVLRLPANAGAAPAP